MWELDGRGRALTWVLVDSVEHPREGAADRCLFDSRRALRTTGIGRLVVRRLFAIALAVADVMVRLAPRDQRERDLGNHIEDGARSPSW